MEYTQFYPGAFALLYERVLKRYFGQTTNEERVKELTSQLEAKLDGYEAILRKQKYLAGDVRAFHSFRACAKGKPSI
jgi:glutathione S-transferase